MQTDDHELEWIEDLLEVWDCRVAQPGQTVNVRLTMPLANKSA